MSAWAVPVWNIGYGSRAWIGIKDQAPGAASMVPHGHPSMDPHTNHHVSFNREAAEDRTWNAPGSARVKLYFPNALAGDIPFHCHLVDHEDNGMMGIVRVIPSSNATGAQVLRKAELGEVPASHICRTPG